MRCGVVVCFVQRLLRDEVASGSSSFPRPRRLSSGSISRLPSRPRFLSSSCPLLEDHRHLTSSVSRWRLEGNLVLHWRRCGGIGLQIQTKLPKTIGKPGASIALMRLDGSSAIQPCALANVLAGPTEADCACTPLLISKESGEDFSAGALGRFTTPGDETIWTMSLLSSPNSVSRSSWPTQCATNPGEVKVSSRHIHSTRRLGHSTAVDVISRPEKATLMRVFANEARSNKADHPLTVVPFISHTLTLSCLSFTLPRQLRPAPRFEDAVGLIRLRQR